MTILRHRRTTGFVLIEILVSFTILALVLGAVLTGLSGSMRAVAAGADYTRAVLLARSKLEALRTESEAEIGAREGVLRDAPTANNGSYYRWRTTVSPYEGEPELEFDSLPVAPMTLTVEVSWEDAGKWRSVALTTLHLERKSKR